MGLFKPAWMASDYSKHEKAIAAVKKITDPDKLFEIAMTAPLRVVRQAALERISDERTVARILLENDQLDVRESALKRVSDPAVLKTAAMSSERYMPKELIDKIDDVDTLIEIALGSPNPNDKIRGNAISKLEYHKDPEAVTQLIDALLALTDRCPEGRERHFAFNSINDIISSKHTFDREYHLPRAQCEKLVDAIIADRDGSYRPDAHLAIDLHAGFTDADSRRMAESAANPAIRQFVWRHMSHTLDELLPAYREAVQNGWEDIQSSVYDRLRKLESGDAAVLMDFVRGTDNLTIREICAVRLVQDDMDGVEGIEAMRDEAVEAYMAAFESREDKRNNGHFMCQFALGLTPAAREKYGFTVSTSEVADEDQYGRYTYDQTTVTYRGKTYQN